MPHKQLKNVELGLVVLVNTMIKHGITDVKLTSQDIAEICGCSNRLIFYIEREALSKMRKRLTVLKHTLAFCLIGLVCSSSAIGALQTPKGKELQDSLGTPMFTMKMLIPQEVAFIIVPPVITNVVVSVYCTPTPGASYHFFIGTNSSVNTDWSWSEVSLSNSASWNVKVPEGTRFYGRAYVATRTGTVKSEIASSQPFPADAWVIWWTPPDKNTIIEVTQNFKTWTTRYSGVTPPITNKFDFTKPYEFFRAVTTNVMPEIGMYPTRTWNAKLEHYGGDE